MPEYPRPRPGRPDRFPRWAHGGPQAPTTPLDVSGPTADPWAVRVRAQAVAAAGGAEPPAYGSPEWTALPEDHPLRVAAAVQAAEAWRTWWTPTEHARRLAGEVDGLRAEREAAEQRRLVQQVNATANRMLTRPGPPTSTPVHDAPGWPQVARPGAKVAGMRSRPVARAEQPAAASR